MNLLFDVMHYDFDIKIVEFFNNLTNIKFFEYLFKGISYLGTETVFLVLITVVYWTINKKLAKDAAIPAFYTIVFGNVIKGFVQRLRPFQQSPSTITCRDESILQTDTDGNYIMEEGGYYKSSSTSFPSGHSTGSSALYNGFAYQLKKRLFWIISTVICLLVMISRMALGVHFLTDVLTGYILGIVCIILYNLIDNKVSNKKLFHIILMCAFGILTFLSLIYSDKPKDIFTGYGAAVGVEIGSMFEEKYVNFKPSESLWKNVLRIVLGLALLLGIKSLLKLTYSWAFEENTPICCILDMFRYIILVFIGTGVYPILFNKLKFLN